MRVEHELEELPMQTGWRSAKSTATPSGSPPRGPQRATLAGVVQSLLGDDLPVAISFWDGSRIGPDDPPATIEVRSRDALSRIVTAPGELGFARAYVAGDIDIVGDIYSVLDLQARLPSPKLTPKQWWDALQVLGIRNIRHLPAPAEEIRNQGRLHSLRRDRQAISHHYDVSNDFYEMVLGPAMTYSCALFHDRTSTLEEAQWAKYELVCGKLGLRPGMRLLDVGCGWGSMALHAARQRGVDVVGITISSEQAAWAQARVESEGMQDRVEIRVQDYREITDGPFDAISSIGMFEHVGASQLGEYFTRLHALLRPGGRLLNHAISRPRVQREAIAPRSFVGRYVFPDAALMEVGQSVTAMQTAGFEARHLESLREHYARTLRCWVENLESNWDRAVAEVGESRAKVWRLYMAGSAAGFEAGRINVNQTLGIHTDEGRSGMPLRPDWDPAPVATSRRSYAGGSDRGDHQEPVERRRERHRSDRHRG